MKKQFLGLSREELVELLVKNQNESQAIRNAVDEIDYDKKYAEQSKFVGNYYKEINKHNNSSIICYYVYGINKDNCDLKTLEISYYLKDDLYYSIEYRSFFDPNNKDSIMSKVKKITKKEFEKHYNKVLEIINNNVNNENNGE